MAAVSYKDATEALDISITERPLPAPSTATSTTQLRSGSTSPLPTFGFASHSHIAYRGGDGAAEHRLEWTNAENVTGGNHNDVIRGDGRDNRIRGRGGNDVIAGGAGNDRLNGGGGDDVFVIESGGGRDEIRDDRGNGTVYLKDFTAEQILFDRDGSSSDLLISVLGTDQQVRVKDYFDSNGNGSGRLNVVTQDRHEVSGALLDETIARHEYWSSGGIPETATHIGHVYAQAYPTARVTGTSGASAPGTAGLPFDEEAIIQAVSNSPNRLEASTGAEPVPVGTLTNFTWNNRSTDYNPFANLAAG